MLHVLEHALIDSLKVFIIIFLLYSLFSILEKWIKKGLNNKGKIAPLLGSLFGIAPQCGISIIASDMYIKRHITMGTLISVYIACSDEAIPILLSNPDKMIMIIPILISKIILGFIIGFIVDLIYTKKYKTNDDHSDECINHHCNCCDSKIHQFFIHPLIHSIQIFIYVFIINFLFGTLIHYLGEENIISFLQANKYLSPLLSSLVGLIPNCASSIIITELYIINGISFGACLAGLICNCGLGSIFLFKKVTIIKEAFIIMAILLVTAILTGYVTCFIFGF